MNRKREVKKERKSATSRVVERLYMYGVIQIHEQEYATLTRRGVWLFSLGLFMLAAVLRVAFYVAHLNSELITMPILDGAAYLTWAKEILAGVPRPLGAFFTEPGYAYLIALSLKVFNSFTPIIWLQLLLGSTTPIFTFFTARRVIKNDVAAIISGLLIACFRPSIFHDVLLLKTSFELWLVAGLLLWLSYIWNSRTTWQFFVAGLIIGVTALIKANVLYVVPLLVLALLVPKPKDVRRAVIVACALVVGALIAISPATIHNYRTTGSLIPINYSGGVTVYIGNWEMADGSFMVPEYFSLDPIHEETSWHAIAEALSGKELTASETSSYWLHEGVREVVQFPVHFITVTLKKIYLLFAGIEIADNYAPSFGEIRFPLLYWLVPYWFVALAGLVGLILFVRRERIHEPYLYAFLVGYSGLIIMSKVAERYRLALALVFVLYAGYAIQRFIALASKRRKRIELVVYGSMFVGIAALLVALHPTVVTTAEADMYLSYAGQYMDEGDYERAQTMAEAGLALSPDHEPLRQTYANTLLWGGDPEAALEAYREAIRSRPDASTKGLAIAYECVTKGCTDVDVRAKLNTIQHASSSWTYDKDYLEGMRELRRGEADQAAALFAAAYTTHPDIRGLKSNIALLYGKQKNDKEAQKYLIQAIVENPFDVVAFYNLGNAYSRANDAKQSIPYYERVNELVPDFNLTRYYLGRAYFTVGETWKAREQLSAFVTYSELSGIFPEQVGKSKQLIGQVEQGMMNQFLPSQNNNNKENIKQLAE